MAVDTCSAATEVPRSLRATEERPSPNPRSASPTAAPGTTSRVSATTTLPRARTARPRTMVRRAPHRRVQVPATVAPGITDRLSGRSRSPASKADNAATSCRWMASSTALELVAAVFTNEPNEPAASRGCRSVLSGTIGAGHRNSHVASSAPSTRPAVTASPPTDRDPGRSKSAAPSTNAITDPVSRSAPTTSTDRTRSRSGRARTDRRTPAPRATATGTLTQNTDRHPRESVRNPPRNKPLAPAAAPAALHRASAHPLAAGSLAVARSRLSAAGTDRAEAVPCTARASTSCHPASASEPIPPASANRTSPMINRRRCPYLWPTREPSTSSPPNNIAYAVASGPAHDPEAPTPRSIDGIATTALVTPSTSTNCTRHSTSTAEVVPVRVGAIELGATRPR